MIQKIKDLMQVKEQLGSLKEQVTSQGQAVAGLKEEMNEFRETFEGVSTVQKELVSSFKNDIPAITESKEALEKEVYDFKILKSQLQNQILKKFEEELSKELAVNTEKIQSDLKDYNEMHEKVGTLVRDAEAMSSEIEKFNEISKTIKKGDFELGNFAKQLQKDDSEKLALMKKIDTLERLIAKMRRR